ncbi:MAG: PAS domain-containing protein [Asticcacaulis sp.]
MPQNDTEIFLAYWRGLKGTDAQAPARARFDPAALRTLVPRLMMLTARDGFRFRLAGEVIEQMHGLGLKTRDFATLFSAEHQAAVTAALTAARYREQALRLSVSAMISHETIEIDLVLAPLRNAEGLTDRFVGLYAPQGALPDAFQDERLFEGNRAIAGRLTLKNAKLETESAVEKRSHLRLIVLHGRQVA